MPETPRPVSRYQLLAESSQSQPLYLRHSRWMGATPPETITHARIEAGQAWQAMRADPQGALHASMELDKLDRAMVATRRQLFAARNEAVALRSELDRARGAGLQNPVVYGVGALAAVCFAGWLYQRRELLALRRARGGAPPSDPPSVLRIEFPPPANAAAPAMQAEPPTQNTTAEQREDWIALARDPEPVPR